MTLRSRLAATGLLVVTILVMQAGIASAAASPAWKELGGSAHGSGVSQTPLPKNAAEPSVAIGTDGRPVVAYTEYADVNTEPSFIIVKRWTGTTWETLSGPVGLDFGVTPQVRVAASGTIYVAWLRDGQVRLMRRVPGGEWAPLAGSTSLDGATTPLGAAMFSLALDLEGNPIVAFEVSAQTSIISPAAGIAAGTPQVYVTRYTPGLGWHYLGSDPFTGGGASEARSFPVGPGLGYARHFAGSPSLTVDAFGMPVVAFVYGNFEQVNSDIYVTAWDGTAWNAVGPAVPQADDGGAARGGPGGVSSTSTVSSNPSLAASPTGALWLAWIEETAASDQYIYARRWMDGSWQEIAGSASGTGLGGDSTHYVRQPQVAVDPRGADADGLVVWSRTPRVGPGEQVLVKRAGSAPDARFEAMGPGAANGDGISAATIIATSPAVAASSDGPPVVVWLDWKNLLARTQVFLRQFATAQLSVLVSGGGRVVSTPAAIACPGGACTEIYSSGEMVSLTPLADPDAIFDRWTGSCSGGGGCALTMSAPRAVHASFVSAATLKVTKTGTGAAFGSVKGAGVACGVDCDEKYRTGTPVTLTVGLPTGTLFDGWGGDCAARGRNTSCSLVMNGNQSVTAAFSQRIHRLTVGVGKPVGTAGRGALGSVLGACAPSGPGTCVTELEYGARVTLNAIAEFGNRFITWQGTHCGGRANATCELTLVGNATVTALFRGITIINVANTGNGVGTLTGPGIACDGDCTGEVFTNTNVTLRFAPAVGSLLLQWEGDVCQGAKTPTCTFVAANDVTVNARAELRRHRLTVTPRANATVVSTTPLPDAIDCGAICTSTLEYGSIVGLQAMPQPGLLFTRWTGNAPCSAGTRATNASCVFVLTADVTATPTYRTGTTVTVAKTGGGQGTVGISGTLNVGVSCAPSCPGATVQAFDRQPVKLTATASVGSTFTGFAGACTSPGPSCSFVADGAAENVNANFVLQPRTVLVNVRGDGIVTGTSAAPDVVTCDAIGCPVVGLYSQEVELTATPGTGNRFIAWSGCTRASGSVCRVKLTNPTATPVNVTAVFSVSLTVERLGDGTGTVSGPGISCGADCVETYTPGTIVTLSQAAAPGSGFDAWLSDCDVLPNGSCVVAMNMNRHVGVTFGGPRTLTVVKAGIGNGTVTSDPPGINCGTTCTAVFPYRSTVTVTATAAPGSIVDPIDPSCIAAGNRTACTFMLTGDGPLNVAFNPPGGLAVQIFGVDRGRVISNDGEIDCGAGRTACTMRYALGTVVRLTAVPEGGALFTGWGGACAGVSNASCALTVAAQTGLSASFASATPITVDVRGAGTGRVTVNPDFGQPPCVSPGPCTLLAPAFTVVTLTPSASSGVFGEWGGACAGISRDGSCSLYADTNRSVTASFLLDPVMVQVTATEDLAIRDADRQCNEPCERFFERGSVVTFEPAPRLGRIFTGWDGDCAAFGNASCVIELAGNRSVSGTVAVEAYSITVDFYAYYYGGGGGEIRFTGSTGTASCFMPCTVLFAPGDTVTIEVFPDEFTVFYGFDYDCDFFSYPCTLTMERDYYVAAYLDYYYCYFCFGAAPPDAALAAPGRRDVHAPDTVRLARRPAVDAGLAAQAGVAAQAVVQPDAGGQQAAVDHDVLARHEA